jgi:Bacterial EndoU nuclease
VLRAADGEAPEVADSQPDRSGWDSVDAADRPPEEGMRVSDERTTHILHGDEDGGGGHRHGTGIPGKTEFPANWEDKKIIDAVVDVARRPDLTPKHQEWNDRWVARGTRDDVEVVVVVARDGRIWTSWPTPDSPGVVKNPKEP